MQTVTFDNARRTVTATFDNDAVSVVLLALSTEIEKQQKCMARTRYMGNAWRGRMALVVQLEQIMFDLSHGAAGNDGTMPRAAYPETKGN